MLVFWANASTPACMARARSWLRSELVSITTRISGHCCSILSGAATPSSSGILEIEHDNVRPRHGDGVKALLTARRVRKFGRGLICRGIVQESGSREARQAARVAAVRLATAAPPFSLIVSSGT